MTIHCGFLDPQTTRASHVPIAADQPPADIAVDAPALREPASFKVEVMADASNTWTDNAVRLPSETEAQDYGRHLKETWQDVYQWRVLPSDEPANATFSKGVLTFRSS